MGKIPKYQADLFNDEVLAETYEHYRAIRDLDPVVHLAADNLAAASRYADARTAFGGPATYSSGEGVELNEVVNRIAKANTLMSDGEHHRVQRAAVGQPLTRKSLAAAAEPGCVRHPGRRSGRVGLIRRRYGPRSAHSFHMVPDLLGWPAEAREHLLDWANASFKSLGPSMQGISLPGPTS